MFNRFFCDVHEGDIFLRKFCGGMVFFWRGMDSGQVHPKQTWIMEYIESANQTASFILRMEPKFTLR